MQVRSKSKPLPHIAGPSNAKPKELRIEGSELFSFDYGFELDDEAVQSPHYRDLQCNSEHREPPNIKVDLTHRDADLDQSPVLFRPSLRLVPE